jgi:hypothetical protein
MSDDILSRLHRKLNCESSQMTLTRPTYITKAKPTSVIKEGIKCLPHPRRLSQLLI